MLIYANNSRWAFRAFFCVLGGDGGKYDPPSRTTELANHIGA